MTFDARVIVDIFIWVAAALACVVFILWAWVSRGLMQRAWRAWTPNRPAVITVFMLILGYVTVNISSKAVQADMDRLAMWLPRAYLAAVVLAGLYSWAYSFRRRRAIEDVPITSIDSTNQGYAKLHGKAVQLEGTSLIQGISDTPCLWYRYVITRLTPTKRNAFLERREAELQGEAPSYVEMSMAPFAIRDETGVAAILPRGGRIVCAQIHKVRGDTFYDEERIMPGDPLYVMGEFSTWTPIDQIENTASGKKMHWKDDKQSILPVADLNRDGAVDRTANWEMRKQVLREPQLDQAHTHACQESMRSVVMPRDGRPLVIWTGSEREVVRQFAFWERIGLLLVLGGMTSQVWLLFS